MVGEDKGVPGLRWRKSTFSEQNACVEVAFAGSAARVRNSRNTAGEMLAFSWPVWAGFLRFIAER